MGAGKRKVPGKKGGTKQTKERAKEKLLSLLAAEPNRSIASILRSIGYSTQAYDYWRKNDENFIARLTRIQRASQDEGPPDVPPFEEFRHTYLNEWTTNPYTGRRQQVGITYPYMRPMLEALQDPDVQRLLVLMPVRHAKTAIMEQFVIQQFCRSPGMRVINVCSSISHGEERAYNIQRMLMDDVGLPDLHSRWGAWIGPPEGRLKPWKKRSFYLRGRNDPQRSPSFQTFGITSKVYGARGDLIWLDDIDDPGNSPDKRQKILWALDGPISNRLTEGGKIVVIGTRCGVDDIYSHLMERPGWKVIVMSAIQPDGTPLCSEMYSLEELEMFRQDNEVTFQLMYQNDPAPEGTMLFPPQLVQLAQEVGYGLGEAPEDWEKVCALDPAATGTAALVTVAHNKQGALRVVDCSAKNSPRYDDIFGMVQAVLMHHHPRYVIIEESGSTFLTDYPEIQRLIYDNGASLVRFHTGRDKVDPRVGMGLIASKMVQRQLTFAWKDAEAQRVMRPLCNELISWRPTGRAHQHGHHWDRTMALWFAVNFVTGTYRPSPGGNRPPPRDPLTARRPWLTGIRR